MLSDSPGGGGVDEAEVCHKDRRGYCRYDTLAARVGCSPSALVPNSSADEVPSNVGASPVTRDSRAFFIGELCDKHVL